MNKDCIVGIICLSVSAVMLYFSRSFPTATSGASDLTGPSFYPNLLALMFALCGTGEIIAGIRHREQNRTSDPMRLAQALRNPGFLNVIFIIVSIIGFMLLMEILGFIICSYLIVFILMWRFGVGWIRNSLYSFIFVALVYLLFGKLFTIYLPSGILEYFRL
jgi:putative tricarboxylic transport membrane protein